MPPPTPSGPVFTSLDVTTVQPDAVLFLGNPLVSQYEVDVYLSLWIRLHHKKSDTSGKRCVPFVCTDGSWKKLVKECSSGGNDGRCTAMYPFHVSCGDMDSQPPPPITSTSDPSSSSALSPSPTTTIPRIPAPTVAALTPDQLAQIQAYIDGTTSTVDDDAPPYIIVPITNDQDTTDFDKCLSLVKHLLPKKDEPSSSANPKGELPLVLVVGALGGRFDHTMAVITSIIRVRDDMRVVVHNASNTLFCCARSGMTKFHHSPKIDGRSCGVMVFGEATSSVVTTGLEWNLGDPALVTGFLGMCLSTSNSILPPPTTPPLDVKDREDTLSSIVTIDTSPVANEGRNSAVIFSVERQT